MSRLSEKHTKSAMRAFRTLMVTYGADGPTYALDSGVGVTLKAAKAITNGKLVPSNDDLFIVSNEDGLFPGMPQTWRAL